jgi:hypothetical protein
VSLWHRLGFVTDGGSSMQCQGCVLTEQNVTFGIAIVKQSVLNNSSQAREAIASFSAVFGHVPTVLMAQDSRGIPTYYGRTDIVNFLANVSIDRIPWQRYTLN